MSRIRWKLFSKVVVKLCLHRTSCVNMNMCELILLYVECSTYLRHRTSKKYFKRKMTGASVILSVLPPPLQGYHCLVIPPLSILTFLFRHFLPSAAKQCLSVPRGILNQSSNKKQR